MCVICVLFPIGKAHNGFDAVALSPRHPLAHTTKLSYLCSQHQTITTMKKLSYAFIALALIVFAVYFLFSAQKSKAPQAPIRLSWQMIQNEVRPGVCESQLTIHNLTADTLQANWTLYYCQMSLAPLTIENEQIHVNQICASYHSVAPTDQYEPIPPHESRTYTLNHRGNVMRKSNAPEGAYIILSPSTGESEGAKPISVELTRITSNDAHEFQRNIYYFPYADGEWMYEQNSRFTVETPYMASPSEEMQVETPFMASLNPSTSSPLPRNIL